jgi:hypothetical protein
MGQHSWVPKGRGQWVGFRKGQQAALITRGSEERLELLAGSGLGINGIIKLRTKQTLIVCLLVSISVKILNKENSKHQTVKN